jgi:phosphotransferase system enzyme I (PtsP)
MTSGAGATGPRVLLRRLRELMADKSSAQDRLDRIVKLIAANMVAEVCSVYLMRQGGMLELFATEGLKPEAVHKTRLKIGEGLIGTIAESAEPLMLADAWAHPSFAYRPETGEEIFHSLMGAPIIIDGHVAGVLAVQNRRKRVYVDEESEALQTIAMVLAEMIGSGGLVARDEIPPEIARAALPIRIEGMRLADGLAMGVAVLHEPKVEIRNLIAENIPAEKERLRVALEAMRLTIDAMLDTDAFSAGGEHREVLEAYRMFAHDKGWMLRIEEAIGSGLTAEAAVHRVQIETHARMQQVSDSYLRERLHDLDDLANRLLRQLVGATETAAAGLLPEDSILLAHNMGPAELLDYDRKRLRAIALEESSPNAHVAIVARALDIPVVGRLEGLLARVEPGDRIIVDAEHAQIFVRPHAEVVQAFSITMANRAARRAEYAAMRDLPSVTRDGTRIALYMNAGLLVDLPQLRSTGADGIGLYRTELLLMVRSAFPDVAAQAEFYAKVLDQAEGKPVVFRTFDIGGDKAVPFFGGEREENPALGWRAIRIGLDRPVILRTQLRALLESHAGRRLDLMFPMIADVAEFDAAKRMLKREVSRLRRLKKPEPSEVRVGTMLEVPALAFQLDALLSKVDFVSVGSNDLIQFLFASDRGNARVAERYDSLAPALLGLLRHLVQRCAHRRVPLSLCGEMASGPLEAMALIGLGFRSLSMAPAAVGPVKAMLRALDVQALSTMIESLLNSGEKTLRPKLEAYAKAQGIPL